VNADLREVLEAEALSWAAECARTSTLDPRVALEMPLAARLLVHALPHDATEDALQGMTSEDVEAQFERLAHRTAALDPEALADALVELLVWAAKSGRIRARKVEYAARKKRGELAANLGSEQGSPGVQFTMAAMRDGVEPEDHDAVRAHAISRG
jgi:hypothetical protein